jgi:hypothetical protein
VSGGRTRFTTSTSKRSPSGSQYADIYNAHPVVGYLTVVGLGWMVLDIVDIIDLTMQVKAWLVAGVMWCVRVQLIAQPLLLTNAEILLARTWYDVVHRIVRDVQPRCSRHAPLRPGDVEG